MTLLAFILFLVAVFFFVKQAVKFKDNTAWGLAALALALLFINYAAVNAAVHAAVN